MNSNGEGISEDVSYTLNSTDEHAVAHTLVSEGDAHSGFRDEKGLVFDTTQITSPDNFSNPKPDDPCHPLAAEAHAPAMMRGMQVRRLTPMECARLQGFPDDYLDIEFRGKPAADGPKYKALGNSMAVPCMRWIGSRILTSISESAAAPDFRDTTKNKGATKCQ